MKFKRINKDDICDFIFDVGCTAFMVPIVSIMFAHDGIKRRYNKIPSVAKNAKELTMIYISWKRNWGLNTEAMNAFITIHIITKIVVVADRIITMP